MHVGKLHIHHPLSQIDSIPLWTGAVRTLFEGPKQQQTQPTNYILKSVKWECAPPT